MADDELLVTISGPAFSLLLYENRRIVDQIGFFLGEILVYVTKKVTDVDREIEHTKYHIDVKSIVAYPIGEPFFNTIGQIDREKLDSVLGKHVKNVVGWYHFREEFPTMKPTFRDRNLHVELTKFFTNKNELLVEENFVFCILTSSVSEIGGTHKFKHLILRKESTVFKPVSLKISNLGADASRADGSDYKPKPTYSSKYDAFNKVYSHIKNDLKNASGVEAVTMIQAAADNLLEELIPKISESDQQVSELEDRLMVLRHEYFRRQFEQHQLQKKMEKMEVDCQSDTNSQPKSPETLELLEIEKSPEASVSNLKQINKEFENLDQRQRRSSTDQDVTSMRGGKDNQRLLSDEHLILISGDKDDLSGNPEQNKTKKSAKPVHQFITDSTATAATRSKSGHPSMRGSSPEYDSDT